MAKDKHTGSHITVTGSSEETSVTTEIRTVTESSEAVTGQILQTEQTLQTERALQPTQTAQAVPTPGKSETYGGGVTPGNETADKSVFAEPSAADVPAANAPAANVPAPIKAVPMAFYRESVRGGSGDPPAASVGAEPEAGAFVDQVYKQINSVLGGSNPNQFLCLTIPGQALSAEDFTYDYKNNAPKGPVVEANESRLVNKLFDPCRMTGADNGLTLPYQYRSALDMLTPKLNAKVAAAKNQIRDLLMTDYPYEFGDGKTYTLQEVFFRLYDDWVKAEAKWADEQNEEKQRLRQVYLGEDAESNMKYNDAYLEWYESVAKSRLTGINEKFSKLISVFTDNDMKILEGILDSGSGAELQQARETLNNTGKLTPDGGYVYPVKLNPTGWFELLGTSFTPIDLLKDPDVLAMELQSLSSRRIALNARIEEISSLIPKDGEVEKCKAAAETAKKDVETARNALIETYGSGAVKAFSAVMDILPLFSGGVPMNIIKKLAAGTELSGGKSLEELIKSLSEQTAAASQSQQDYISACGKLADVSAKAIEVKNLAGLGEMLSPLRAQLLDIDSQISTLQAQIQLSALSRPAPDEDGNVTDPDTGKDAVAPSVVPEGYTQVVITASASTLDKSTSSRADASASTSGFSFLFCGYHSEQSSSSSAFSSFTSQSDTSIQIGMNVAKVGIEREWFNPGVFALTKDMFNVTSLKIAPNPAKPYTGVTDDRLTEMATGGYIFPCYPVAMVIARDITIKLVSSSSVSSEFSESVESHASSGGGFLFFSGSKSSSSSSSSSGVHSSSTGNTVTLKFDTPQIIGYYLEATAADKSSRLDDISGDSQAAGYVSISKFVEDYKKMLEAKKEKMKKKEEKTINN